MAKWEEGARLDHVDLLMLLRGRVSRADLIERFGISESQASGDLREFDRLYPGTIAYDLRAKEFRPVAKRYRTQRGQRNPTAIAAAWAALADAGSRLGWRAG